MDKKENIEEVQTYKPLYRIYKPVEGDIFTIDFKNFSKDSSLWNNPHVFILGFDKVRLKKKILWFHFPELFKHTIVQFMYKDKVENKDKEC